MNPLCTRMPIAAIIALSACQTPNPTPPQPAASSTAAPAPRKEAIDALKTFIQEHPDDQEHRPDALLRLALLHLEEAQEEPSDSQSQPSHTQQAIEVLNTLIDNHPQWPKLDDALHLRAFVLIIDGQEPRAQQDLQRIIADHPQSQHVREAWVRIGEYLFDTQDLPGAARAYQHALVAQGDRYTPQILYKLGWTHYRQDQYPQAIGRFKEVLSLPDSPDAQDLKEEAIGYIAVSLIELDWDVDGAPDAAQCPPALPESWAARCHPAQTLTTCRVQDFFSPGEPHLTDILLDAVDFSAQSAQFPQTVALSAMALECLRDPTMPNKLGTILAQHHHLDPSGELTTIYQRTQAD